METYLVTGGAGFVGSTVARELRQAGHRVIVFDDLSKGHREALPDDITLVHGDLADRAAIDRVLAANQIDAVLHFAAFIEAGENDNLIASALGRKLYDAAQSPKQFLLVEGGSHFSTMSMGQAQYRQALAQLFSLH